ncbi:MAG: hypothetical protein V4501_06180 [Pseudomonadota bacterium]
MSMARSPSKEKLNDEVQPELVVDKDLEKTTEETNVNKVTEELGATKLDDSGYAATEELGVTELDDSAAVARQDSEIEEKKEEEVTLAATAEKEPEVEKAAEEENSEDKKKVQEVPLNFGTLPQTTFGGRKSSKPDAVATLTQDETPRPRSPGGTLS